MKEPGALRVLHLSNSVSSLGNGIVNVAVDLAIEQVQRGITVGFMSGGGGWISLLEASGVKTFTFPHGGWRNKITTSWKLFRLLRTFRPDVVHAHMRTGLVLAWPLTTLLRIPLVMHLHNIHDEKLGTAKLANRVIAVSRAVANDLQQVGLPADHIRVVLNGMLGSKRLSPDVPSKELTRPAIVCVAGMTVRKGILELIEAFGSIADEFPGASLYLVGGGSAESAMIREVAANSPVSDRIHFEDFQADPRAYLASSDVFVLASRREAFGLALVEARAAGCAIVATNVDGIPEIIEDGKTGLLIGVNDPADLAAKIRLLLTDDALRTKLKAQAREHLELYSVERMTTETTAVYSELL
ncbi:glycosyltransferase family 4 protein [Terriglobus saanensis]|uniref:Glycosyl transferase group 1 n=1 Tax=Terriglobus saanensis (strain ATCC BAA-1853 / DSM 23119 / SP1PR4) TaxID=401053 RepID=E8V6N0_TERSS|nr:glycosyltransferase family 4 protein [Terriglobus saanensis]ADV82769.1 glycosyl transferase group 1 [Terriglobus saanensis SP1PR4]